MDKRQSQLLNLVIESYIDTAEPVGSKFLVATASLNWSEATVRNDLRFLEEQGYLTHPHTSAGRVPTLKGYQFYVGQLNLNTIKYSKKEGLLLEEAIKLNADLEAAQKNIAKELVVLSSETVIVAFSPEKVYYTGLANLFKKPDFMDFGLVAEVFNVFDTCEDCLPNFFDEVSGEPKYFLGSEHPFGNMLSVLSMKFNKGNSLIALFGPQRMDYKHNWGLMNKVKELI